MPLNSVNQDQMLGLISSEFFTISYKNSAGEYQNIPGAQDIDFGGSAAPPRDNIPANGAPLQRLGRSRVGQVSFNAFIMPADPAWRFLRDAQYDRTLCHFRVEFDANEQFNSASTNGATCSISTGGVLTFQKGSGSTGEAAPTIAGTGIGRGMMVKTPKTGTPKGYIITGVDDSDEITAVDMSTYAAPATAVTTQPFVLYSPAPLRRDFSAFVSQATDFQMGAEAEATTSVVLAPPMRLPDFTTYLPA